MTIRRLGIGAAIVLIVAFRLACLIGGLTDGGWTPFWPFVFVVAALQAGSGLAELRRGQQMDELLRGRAAARTPRRIGYEAAAVTVVGAGAGATAAWIWHATSGCLAGLPPDAPLGACGTLVTVLFGVPILAAAAAACLVALRVKWGSLTAVAAAPIAAAAVTLYRSAAGIAGGDPDRGGDRHRRRRHAGQLDRHQPPGPGHNPARRDRRRVRLGLGR